MEDTKQKITKVTVDMQILMDNCGEITDCEFSNYLLLTKEKIKDACKVEYPGAEVNIDICTAKNTSGVGRHIRVMVENSDGEIIEDDNEYIEDIPQQVWERGEWW